MSHGAVDWEWIGVSVRYEWSRDDPANVRDKESATLLSLSEVSTKIAVYEDRVRGWFLGYIEKLRNDNDAGYVRLALAVAQIEGMEQNRQGRSSRYREGEMFRAGVIRIFPELSSASRAVHKLWSGVRCGLFHDGFTKEAVYISETYGEAVEHVPVADVLKVNPTLFGEAVARDFSEYCAVLRDGSDARLVENFERMWDAAWENAKACFAIGSAP